MASSLDQDLLDSFEESPLRSPAFDALRLVRRQCEADLLHAFEPSPVAMRTISTTAVTCVTTESSQLVPFCDNTTSAASHSPNEFLQLAEHLASGNDCDFDDEHEEDLLEDMFEPETKAAGLVPSDSNSDFDEGADSKSFDFTQSTQTQMRQIRATPGGKLAGSDSKPKQGGKQRIPFLSSTRSGDNSRQICWRLAAFGCWSKILI